MKIQEVRQKFIEFFQQKDHEFAAPSPVVPQNDPSLLFTNAGMNQFKDVFLGAGTRPYTRAVNSQVCIRVSGKHNDLEDVGLDTTHHTLFEMLGNWSFGDYYKREAIQWAWELFTQVYGLPKAALYATIYETDDESGELWKKITDINPAHILKFGNKDNFWEMAQTGPCGPCSEIHLDRGADHCDKKETPHTCSVNGICARYIELWNLVFIQYERQEDGSLLDLPQKHVDTGAGLERIVAYLQHTASNYETDLFEPIIKKIETLTGIPYSDGIQGMPHRVIADHIRTLTFGIADNILPSNDGRGYVLRRILRRGLRYAQKLNITQPILYKLVGSVIDAMGSYYDYLPKRKDFIENVIKSEEEGFLKTLTSGVLHFQNVVDSLVNNSDTIPGKEAFKLYDTFGFPIDLTELMARERGLKVDLAGFRTELNAQRAQSRNHIKLHNCDAKDVPIGGEARIVTHDEDRLKMARHHTGTHLLQAALRQILGEHVYQSGSLVDVARLRFDFSHFKSLSPEQLTEIESLVNAKIEDNIAVTAAQMPLDDAKKKGAMALFGEKYDDVVRVIQIGDFSMDLCGGTHVPSTAAIEKFRIISESAIAAGTRRIEALCGDETISHYQEAERQKHLALFNQKLKTLKALNQESTTLGETPVSLADFEKADTLTSEDIITLTETLLSRIKQQEKQIADKKNHSAADTVRDLIGKATPIGNHKLLIHSFDQYDMGMLRTLSDHMISSDPSLVLVLGSVKDDQALFLARLKKPDLPAADIIKELTGIAGGKGGGRADMAQAGGADPSKLDTALRHIDSVLSSRLS